MTNKNYIKGRRKEYMVKNKFEMAGWEVLRTAGSHGFADLVAIEKKRKKILFIQCKPNNFSEREKQKIEIENKHLFGSWEVDFEII